MIPLSKDDVIKITISDVTYNLKVPVGEVEDLVLDTIYVEEKKAKSLKDIRNSNNIFLSKIITKWSSTKHKLPECDKEHILLLPIQLSKAICDRYIEEYVTSVDELKN